MIMRRHNIQLYTVGTFYYNLRAILSVFAGKRLKMQKIIRKN
jgi:hypothetical protein